MEDNKSQVNYIELRNYFAKLKHVIDNATFSFRNIRIVKKSRIDDIYCCILAILPEVFKDEVLNERKSVKKVGLYNYQSISSFIKFKDSLIRPFFLSGNFYSIDASKIVVYIDEVMYYIEKDINNLVKNKE